MDNFIVWFSMMVWTYVEKIELFSQFLRKKLIWVGDFKMNENLELKLTFWRIWIFLKHGTNFSKNSNFSRSSWSIHWYISIVLIRNIEGGIAYNRSHSIGHFLESIQHAKRMIRLVEIYTRTIFVRRISTIRLRVAISFRKYQASATEQVASHRGPWRRGKRKQ